MRVVADKRRHKSELIEIVQITLEWLLSSCHPESIRLGYIGIL